MPVQVNAYNSWASVKAGGGVGAERAFCSRNFLSPAGMNMLEGMRGQLLSELLNRGLIASLHAASVNATDAGLVRFVLVRTTSSATVITVRLHTSSPVRRDRTQSWCRLQVSGFNTLSMC